MQLTIIAIGNHMPPWVNEGYQTFAKRLPSDYHLNLLELNAEKRLKNSNINDIIDIESKRLLAAVPKDNQIIALDRLGKTLSTSSIAQHLQQWHDLSQDVSILIGGPEGLNHTCRKKAHQRWSLSALTLPHPLVRVLVAEQCYRAWSIIQGHPYHR